MGRKRFSRAGSGNTWPWLMQGISIPARLCRSGIYSCDADDHRFESTVVRGTSSLVSGSMYTGAVAAERGGLVSGRLSCGPNPRMTCRSRPAHCSEKRKGNAMSADEGKKDDPGRVSGGGFGALMAGNDLAVAGSVRLQVAGAGVLPDTMKGELHAKLTGPRV